MVLGLRLACCSEMVSQAPKKMCSTATAEPLKTSEKYLEAGNLNTPGIESMSRTK
jgi:hypothetical protein